ncbi:MAG: hypothetical protein RR290_04050 [Clostridia bacterium]
MVENNNFKLEKCDRREEIGQIVRWTIIPKLSSSKKFTITIAYEEKNRSQNVKILGNYSKVNICDKIIEFYTKFLQDVDSFGLLIVSDDKDVKNWDISLRK